jgi:hypothetical protein
VKGRKVEGCETFSVLHIDPEFQSIFLKVLRLCSYLGMFKKSNEASLGILEGSHGQWCESLSVSEFEDIKVTAVSFNKSGERCDIIILDSGINLCDDFQDLLINRSTGGSLLLYHVGLHRFFKDTRIATLGLIVALIFENLVYRGPLVSHDGAAGALSHSFPLIWVPVWCTDINVFFVVL